MPAPLGNRPTKKMPEIQFFGGDDSPETRAALRFFRERRVVVHYVDLKKRPIAPGELKRFTERLGPAALMDTSSRAYRDAGLGYLNLDNAGIVGRLQADPLARHGNEVTVGTAEGTWAAWVRPKGAS